MAVASRSPPVCRCVPTPVGGLSSLLGTFPSPPFLCSSLLPKEKKDNLPCSSSLPEVPACPSFDGADLASRCRKTEDRDEASALAAAQRHLCNRGSRLSRNGGEAGGPSSQDAYADEDRRRTSQQGQDSSLSSSSVFVEGRVNRSGEDVCGGGGVWLVRGIDIPQLDVHLTW